MAAELINKECDVTINHGEITCHTSPKNCPAKKEIVSFNPTTCLKQEPPTRNVTIIISEPCRVYEEGYTGNIIQLETKKTDEQLKQLITGKLKDVGKIHDRSRT